jgi:hypothetical protein
VPAPDRAALRATLIRHFEAGVGAGIRDTEFDRLAALVFRHQFENNAPYRAYCQSRGVTPAAVKGWLEVPAVPTSAFKAVPLVCGDPSAAEAVFLTSGTTGGQERRGAHYVPDLSLYRASLLAGFAAHLLPDGARPRMLALVAPADRATESSLSYMATAVMETFGSASSGVFLDERGMDVEGLAGALRRASGSGEPVCVLATTSSLIHALDGLGARAERFVLPTGSRVMDTGGFKGRGRAVPRDELYELVEDRIGIPAAWCVNEYGMTEMASQFYDGIAGTAASDDVSARVYRGPPWVRTRAVDPETLEPLPDGVVGILRHCDLANLGSVLSIQTEDLGVREGDGFRLLGRATGAEPRGCSLAAEALLSAARRSSQG